MEQKKLSENDKKYPPFRIIADRYLLLEQLGKGKGSIVHAGLDLHEGNIVAIKIPRLNRNDGYTRMSFSQEAQALERGQHENVVKLLEYGESLGSPYIVLEHLKGKTLHNFLPEKNLKSRLQIARDICGVLEHLHSNGIVHRDLKPKNIIVEKDQKVRIIDFGFAYVDGLFDYTSLFSKRFGSPVYSPPEPTNGSGDMKADIYSAGMIMYQLLIERSKISILDIVKLLELHRGTNSLAAAVEKGKIPLEAAHIIARAVRRNPKERIESAAEMRQSIESILATL